MLFTHYHLSCQPYGNLILTTVRDEAILSYSYSAIAFKQNRNNDSTIHTAPATLMHREET